VTSSTNALTIKGLTVRRGGRTLVDGLELTVSAGEFIAITGPSGAGKTSCIEAFSHPPITALLPQGLHLVPPLTLLANALHGSLRFRSWWQLRATDAAMAEGIAGLTALGLDPSRQAAVASGGERQRTALVRAVLAHPRCLLADEPVSQLDPDTAALTLTWLAQQRQAAGFAVLAVLHQPELVSRFADRILHLPGDGRWSLQPVEKPS
jgi:ABC-type phosphate/phosphonate transport system ATPase subunit